MIQEFFLFENILKILVVERMIKFIYQILISFFEILVIKRIVLMPNLIQVLVI
jgi:hypothetical protein